uniref:TNFR-Cys domain-containing protein n=1 Tax=Strigops habroptila TaxID=2489341 RepID=A0A672V4S4_STRHB
SRHRDGAMAPAACVPRGASRKLGKAQRRGCYGAFPATHSHGNDSICTACPAGTFLSQPNTLTKCQACYECDHQSDVLTNCSATSNVVCGCESGHFRQCHNSACSEFSCQQCEPCAGRLVQRSCSEAQDTVCGGCKPDFYAEGSECRPCHM